MKLDFRDAVFAAAYDVMAADPRTVMLTNDMGAMGFDRIRVDFPERTVNVGICEQNMVSVAAGLALTGRRVFAYGIIAHVYARAFEQLRNDVCCLNLPVIVLGVGSGLSYGNDGPTHHGVQDVAVLRALPSMAIYNPADGIAAGALVRAAAARGGPAHIRMDKEQLAPIYAPDATFDAGFATLTEGRDVALVSTGVLVHRAVEAAGHLAAEGIGVRVIDLYRLKPVDFGAFAGALAGVPAIVTLEENTAVGGLGSLVAETVARRGLGVRLTTLGLADNPLVGAASREWAEREYGLDIDGVVTALRHAAAGMVQA